MLAYSITNIPEDGPIPSICLDHDDFGLEQSKIIKLSGPKGKTLEQRGEYAGH